MTIQEWKHKFEHLAEIMLEQEELKELDIHINAKHIKRADISIKTVKVKFEL